MKRTIIRIDEKKCNGCGICMPNCPEGALQIIDGKARLISDLFCDGLGACIGHCPEGAISTENREAEPYDEKRVMENIVKQGNIENDTGQRASQLTHWPVQLHLMSPLSPAYQGADVVLSADCVAYAYADFHKDWLAGKALAIACPKLDDGQEIYLEKISGLIDEAKINTLTVITMEVPCCRGLLAMAQQAATKTKRKIPVKSVIIGIDGNKLSEDLV